MFDCTNSGGINEMNLGSRACTEILDPVIGMEIKSIETKNYYKNRGEN